VLPVYFRLVQFRYPNPHRLLHHQQRQLIRPRLHLWAMPLISFRFSVATIAINSSILTHRTIWMCTCSTDNSSLMNSQPCILLLVVRIRWPLPPRITTIWALVILVVWTLLTRLRLDRRMICKATISRSSSICMEEWSSPQISVVVRQVLMPPWCMIMVILRTRWIRRAKMQHQHQHQPQLGMGMGIGVGVGVSSGGYYDGVSAQVRRSLRVRHAVASLDSVRTSLSISASLLSIKCAVSLLCSASWCLLVEFLFSSSCTSVFNCVCIYVYPSTTQTTPRSSGIIDSTGWLALAMFCKTLDFLILRSILFSPSGFVWNIPQQCAFLVVLPCCATFPRFLFLIRNISLIKEWPSSFPS